MRTLKELFTLLNQWEQSPSSESPFKLACRIEGGASTGEITQAADGEPVPDELSELWSAGREAWLFEDAEYGQWGLHLLSPSESVARTKSERAERPGDLRHDDVVVGEFLGDSELLVFAPSEQDRRRYIVALPLDPRDDWYAAGASVAEVLERLLAANGEKYWEQSSD